MSSEDVMSPDEVDDLLGLLDRKAEEMKDGHVLPKGHHWRTELVKRYGSEAKFKEMAHQLRQAGLISSYRIGNRAVYVIGALPERVCPQGHG